MQLIKKHLKMLGALAIAGSAILLNSCAPVVDPTKKIDPRFIGTWASKDGRETSVTVLAPTGRGRVFTRRNDRFRQKNIIWRTHANILEMRETGIMANFPGILTLGDPAKDGYTNIDADFKGNVTGFRERKITLRSIRKPSDIRVYYRFSPTPLLDPSVVYGWMDNKDYKVIDRPKN